MMCFQSPFILVKFTIKRLSLSASCKPSWSFLPLPPTPVHLKTIFHQQKYTKIRCIRSKIRKGKKIDRMKIKNKFSQVLLEHIFINKPLHLFNEIPIEKKREKIKGKKNFRPEADSVQQWLNCMSNGRNEALVVLVVVLCN